MAYDISNIPSFFRPTIVSLFGIYQKWKRGLYKNLKIIDSLYIRNNNEDDKKSNFNNDFYFNLIKNHPNKNWLLQNFNAIWDKDFVRNNSNMIKNKLHVSCIQETSGSTGSGLKIPVSQDFLAHQEATFKKYYSLQNKNH